MELAGRSAVVAGGAGGLGGATVRHLVGLGVKVAILDPDADRAGAIVKDLGSEAAFVAGESNEDEAVTEAIKVDPQSLGQFSIAVSATGVVIRSPHLVEADGTSCPRTFFSPIWTSMS